VFRRALSRVERLVVNHVNAILVLIDYFLKYIKYLYINKIITA
jgi:hypothetical protein